MKNISEQTKERFANLLDLYNGALSAMDDTLSLFEKYEKQYNGSEEIDGTSTPALTVRNITYELIESSVNPDVPMPKADSVSYTEQRERNARTIEHLCSAVRDTLPFERMNALDERYTYVYGASVWYVEWDSADARGDVSGIKVHCLSPKEFIPQPGVCEIEDMEYCFLRFTTTKGELIRRYGAHRDDLSLAESEYEYDGGEVTSDTVSLTVAFWRDDDGEIGRTVFSGELLLSDIPRYYSRKLSTCPECGGNTDDCDCSAAEDLSYEQVDASLLTYPADAEKISVRYYTPRQFPIVIRKNVASSPSLYGISDCEMLRYHQQAINKIESRILQKLLRSGITPVMPEDSSVTLNNAVFGQVIKMRPGESIDQYGKIDTTPDISSDIEEADRLYDQAKRLMGISDALVGVDSVRSESGYAKQLKILQSNGRLHSKRQLKYQAYSDLYRMIFEHFLAFSDESRQLSYMDPFGHVTDSAFSKYAFIEKRDGDGEEYYDGYLFTVDLNSGAEYERDELWRKNLANLEAGTLGDKKSPITLLRYWQSQERAHYPYAKENVDYFKQVLMAQNKESEKKNEH